MAAFFFRRFFMILDSLAQANRYLDLHPRFRQAFEFLQSRKVGELTPGNHDLDGKKLYVAISNGMMRGREQSPLESISSTCWKGPTRSAGVRAGPVRS